MHAWEFAKALHLQRDARLGAVRVDAGPLQPARPRGGARDDPALPRRGRRHDRVEPAGRGRLARAWDNAKATARSGNDGFADMLYTRRRAADHAIIDAVGAVAEARGVTGPRSRWPGCTASPSSPRRSSARHGPQIDDAVASLDIELSDEEIARARTAPYTPRYDFQGISDDAELQAVMARLPQFTVAG